MKLITQEDFRNHLIIGEDVYVCGLGVVQYTVEDIIKNYQEFNYMRHFVYFNKDSLSEKIRPQIDERMFDIKEALMMEYQFNNYDLEYDTFDMIGYVHEVNELFVQFLNYFTYHTINKVYHQPIMDMLIVQYDDNKILEIDRKIFGEIIDRFSILNYATSVSDNKDTIKQTDRAKDFDEKARKIKQDFDIKEKPDMTFNSILSWIVNSVNGYTHDNIKSKTIYMIMDTYMRKNHTAYCDMMNRARSNGICNLKENEFKKINYALNLY